MHNNMVDKFFHTGTSKKLHKLSRIFVKSEFGFHRQLDFYFDYNWIVADDLAFNCFFMPPN